MAAELGKVRPGVDMSPFVTLAATHSEAVSAPPLAYPVCSDPDDDKFLACALVARATCLITGDKHLLSVSALSEIQILSPRAFVDKYLES